ncbi:MAG: ComEC/Rec2 family competence protein, partial [Burkholderiaceae bacterium]
MSGKASALHWAWPAIGWLLGLACLQHCERLPRSREYAGLLLLLLLLLALCLLLAWRRRPLPPRSPTLTLSLSLTLTLTLAALLLAFTVGAGRAALRLADALPQAWEGRDLLLEGRVDSLPVATLGQGGAPGWRFEFECQRSHAGPSPDDPPLVLPHRLLLSWYGLPFEAAPPLRAGERWRFVLRLKRPNGLMNPHAFDYEAWLLEQDLRATGLVRPGSAQRLAAAPWWSLDAARQRLREALQRRIADPTVAGVLAALSLGDQAAIGREDWALFRDTSVAHLLSVSGLHVTMFAWLAAAACGALWRRSARLCLYLPAPRLALWAGVAAALAYALFSGWGVPAQRTVWMLASLALLRSLGLRWPWPLSLLAAAVVVTAIDPWAIGQAGFWLSFAAVALLMASGSPPRREAGGPGRWRALLRQGLHSQWVASLGLAPLSLLFFQQISLLGLVANLVAIPLVSFVITPLAFLGIAAPPLWDGAELCVRALMAWLRWLDGWGWAVWRVPVAPPWAQAAGLLGGALLVLPLPAR